MFYLLRIRDGSRILAEAKLEVYDPEAAWERFEEVFGQALSALSGSFYHVVRLACKGVAVPQDVAALDIHRNASNILIPKAKVRRNGPLQLA